MKFQDEIVVWRKSTARKKRYRKEWREDEGQGNWDGDQEGQERGREKWEGRRVEGRGKHGKREKTEHRKENTVEEKDCCYNTILLE